MARDQKVQSNTDCRMQELGVNGVTGGVGTTGATGHNTNLKGPGHQDLNGPNGLQHYLLLQVPVEDDADVQRLRKS